MTSIPLAIITVLCLLLWADGPQLYRLLDTEVSVGSTTRIHVALLVTAGVVIAAAATGIVLGRARLTGRQLRRSLAAVLTVDLVLFNCFIVRFPQTEAHAQARGPLATAFHAQVGDGRFIIYDPDEFYAGQLYALGQTDLNIYRSVPSAQGYTALSSGLYFTATGAHYQEDLNPVDLAGPDWDDLNVTTLLSVPSYFVTPAAGAAGGPGAIPFPSPLPDQEFHGTLPSSFAVAPATVHQWYFGGDLTVHTLAVPLARGSAPPGRLGLLTPSGHRQWLPAADITTKVSDGRRTVEVDLPTPVRAAGLLATGPRGRGLVVGVPVVTTSEAGPVALDGRLQDVVDSPHWVFTGTLGTFGVFRNRRVRGWAWIDGPGVPTGGGADAVATGAPSQDGSQQMIVRTTAPAVLQRSVAWSTGWKATVQPVAAGPGGAPLGPAHSVPVVRSGVIQEVDLLGPGRYRVSFTYAATSALVGVAVSVASTVALAGWAVFELVARRRRRLTNRG